MDKVIYTKYSTERAANLRIRTSILESFGERYIVKYPMTEAARQHVDAIYDMYVALEQLYAGTPVRINTCLHQDTNIRFEYVSGFTFEELLDERLADGDYLGIIDAIRDYKRILLDHCEHHKFIMTDEFRQVFGDMDISMPLEAINVSDIDMIFGNIIIDEENHWNIIDYEWTFSFDVPVNFILYRALCDYLYRSNKRDALWHLELLQSFGITEDEKKLYDGMEKAFQNYVSGNIYSLGTLNHDINRTKYIVKDLLVPYIPGQVQVFYDCGEGYSEDNSEFLNCVQEDDGKYCLHIKNLRNAKSVRIDPSNRYCIAKLDTLQIIQKDGKIEDATFYNNGIEIAKSVYVYNTDDPQWVVPDIEENDKEIIIEFYITVITSELAGICAKECHSVYDSYLRLQEVCVTQEESIKEQEENIKEQEKIIKEQEQSIKEQEENIKEQEESIKEQEERIKEQEQNVAELERDLNANRMQIEEIRNSTSWKITKPIRAIGKMHRK